MSVRLSTFSSQHNSCACSSARLWKHFSHLASSTHISNTQADHSQVKHILFKSQYHEYTCWLWASCYPVSVHFVWEGLNNNDFFYITCIISHYRYHFWTNSRGLRRRVTQTHLWSCSTFRFIQAIFLEWICFDSAPHSQTHVMNSECFCQQHWLATRWLSSLHGAACTRHSGWAPRQRKDANELTHSGKIHTANRHPQKH